MPNVTLKMGSTTDTAIVNESSEILLDCHVKSNPKPTHIRWLFNKKELTQNIAQGMILFYLLKLSIISRNTKVIFSKLFFKTKSCLFIMNLNAVTNI